MYFIIELIDYPSIQVSANRPNNTALTASLLNEWIGTSSFKVEHLTSRIVLIPAGALQQVFGPARTYQTVSYYQALDPANFLPADIFRGRTVIVGLSTQSAPNVDQGGPDTFATSYTMRTRQLVAGAEVQATVSTIWAGGCSSR